jgi:hypothetical protein
MKKLLFTLAITLIAVSADAACLKCNQTTGWWCFMSVDGTYAHCDSPTGAGCFMWGACAASECQYGCEENIVAAVRLTNELQIASVSVTVPVDPPAHARRQAGA